MAKPATTVAAILQQLVKTGREPHDKRDTLRRTIRAADSFKNAIIFCNRKREVPASPFARSPRLNAVALHGTWISRRAPQRSMRSAAAKQSC